MNSAPMQNPTPQQYPPPPAGYRRRKGMSPWLIRIPVLAITGSILLMVVLGLFLFAFQMRHIDRIFPGVSTMGVNLGGLTPSEAAAKLAGAFTYDRDAVFIFRDGDRIWQLSAGDLGVSLDIEGTVDRAFTLGHGSNIIGGLFEQSGAWFSGYSIAPIVEYNQSIAVARLTEIADEINRNPVNATLTVSGTTVQSTPGQHGRRLDIVATMNRLDRELSQMKRNAEIPLVINETPPLIWETNTVAQQLRIALSGPVTLVATDQNGEQLGPWTATPDQIAGLLKVDLVDYNDGTQGYEAHINIAAFETYLQQLAPGLLRLPQDARFHFDETTQELVVIQPGVSGRKLNVEQTLSRLEEAVFSSTSRTVPMAFDFTLPTYHNQMSASELGIKELVAEATTYFTGSTQNRRTNIAVAASKFDGIIIAPQQEFSFNHYLGDITYENGFVDGKVIFGGQTVTGIGGGVCQVSTTIYRAAFTGGYWMKEVHSHGYRVGYYELNSPPGFDAAIWTPDSDFRFLNDTDYHLLIEVSVFPANDAIQFRFYSTKIRTTEIDDPIIQNRTPAPAPSYVPNPELRLGDIVQVDYAAEGSEITVHRRIYDLNGNEIRRDSAYRNYQAWQAIYEVAPGDSRLSNQS